jgi:hypothetical protein
MISDNGVCCTSNPRPKVSTLLANRSSDSRSCKRSNNVFSNAALHCTSRRTGLRLNEKYATLLPFISPLGFTMTPALSANAVPPYEIAAK